MVAHATCNTIFKSYYIAKKKKGSGASSQTPQATHQQRTVPDPKQFLHRQEKNPDMLGALPDRRVRSRGCPALVKHELVACDVSKLHPSRGA